MGNDCEECGAQIPYGQNICEACEMGVTEFYQVGQIKLLEFDKMLDGLKEIIDELSHRFYRKKETSVRLDEILNSLIELLNKYDKRSV